MHPHTLTTLLTLPRMRVLNALTTAGPAGSTEIADRLCAAESSMRLHLRALQDAGVVDHYVPPAARGRVFAVDRERLRQLWEVDLAQLLAD